LQSQPVSSLVGNVICVRCKVHQVPNLLTHIGNDSINIRMTGSSQNPFHFKSSDWPWLHVWYCLYCRSFCHLWGKFQQEIFLFISQFILASVVFSALLSTVFMSAQVGISAVTIISMASQAFPASSNLLQSNFLSSMFNPVNFLQ